MSLAEPLTLESDLLPGSLGQVSPLIGKAELKAGPIGFMMYVKC